MITIDEIKAIWKDHGGRQHGPKVETMTIPESRFMDFCLAMNAEIVKKSKEIVFHLPGGPVTETWENILEMDDQQYAAFIAKFPNGGKANPALRAVYGAYLRSKKKA